MFWLIALQLSAAVPDPAQKVFADNRVALLKTERASTGSVYFVDLPFDPVVADGASHLEAQLASALDCQDFTLVSRKHAKRIRVSARRSGAECMIKEVVEELR